MACSSPLYAWNTGRLTANGKPLYFVTRYPGRPNIGEVNKRLVFELDRPLGLGEFPDGHLVEMSRVPCGTCEGCRFDKAREWADRCTVEASKHKHNWFVTLTYDNDNLPADNLPDKVVLINFIKRVRRKFGKGIKFFASGEKGSRSGRAHYHIIFFGLDLSDAIKIEEHGEESLYYSKALDVLWPFGGTVLGSVTPRSAAYVARYTDKKAGDSVGFVHMSRRPGLANEYYIDNFERILTNGSYPVGQGRVASPPRYFDRLAEKNGVDLSAQKASNKALAEKRIITRMATEHLRNEEEFYESVRADNKHKAARLRRRKTL